MGELEDCHGHKQNGSFKPEVLFPPLHVFFEKKFPCKRLSNQNWLAKSLKVLPLSTTSESCVVLEFELLD